MKTYQEFTANYWKKFQELKKHIDPLISINTVLKEDEIVDLEMLNSIDVK